MWVACGSSIRPTIPARTHQRLLVTNRVELSSKSAMNQGRGISLLFSFLDFFFFSLYLSPSLCRSNPLKFSTHNISHTHAKPAII